VLADDADTASMLSAVTEQFPQLAAMLDKIVIAVNQEYLQGTMALRDGDEIAFIPPISGG
jgi:molybdopterin converting factor small subunit